MLATKKMLMSAFKLDELQNDKDRNATTAAIENNDDKQICVLPTA